MKKRNRSLYTFYAERRWAEAFLEGELLFRSLAYFRDFEDDDTRGDHNEGTAIFRSEGGLVNNQTQGKTFTPPGHAFVSRAKHEESFVFCASRFAERRTAREVQGNGVCRDPRHPEVLRESPGGAAGARDIPRTSGAHAHRSAVEYYGVTEASTPRWALPDMIATSKLASYSWQNEFRLVFSLTGALAFEKVDLRVEPPAVEGPARQAEHGSYLVKTGCLGDICRLKDFVQL
jgi:hypothetical protein